jgi:hypothetical protein
VRGAQRADRRGHARAIVPVAASIGPTATYAACRRAHACLHAFGAACYQARAPALATQWVSLWPALHSCC